MMINTIKNINKRYLVAIVAVAMPICIACTLISACVISAFIPMTPVKHASVLLRVEIPKGTTVISDNYDGENFPTGDGHTWTVLQIPPEKISEFIDTLKASPIWHPLPLPAELMEQEHYLQPTFMSGVEGHIPLSNVTGYYVFIDRQEERNEQEGYATLQPFYYRPSFNYTFGLFNDKDGKLYVWSLDT